MAVLTFPISELLPALAVFALLGHFGLCVFSHNWWYGQALPRHGTSVVQLLHGVLLVGIPAHFWFHGGYAYLKDFDLSYATWPTVVMTGYFSLCCLIGLFVLPFITIRRALRSSPRA